MPKDGILAESGIFAETELLAGRPLLDETRSFCAFCVVLSVCFLTTCGRNLPGFRRCAFVGLISFSAGQGDRADELRTVCAVRNVR